MTEDAWRDTYRRALNEQNLTKLANVVIAAETAIFMRFQELAGNPDHHAERVEMQTAAKGLLAIKIQKLGYPDIVGRT
jgi:hypothetical protein